MALGYACSIDRFLRHKVRVVADDDRADEEEASVALASASDERGGLGEARDDLRDDLRLRSRIASLRRGVSRRRVEERSVAAEPSAHEATKAAAEGAGGSSSSEST